MRIPPTRIIYRGQPAVLKKAHRPGYYNVWPDSCGAEELRKTGQPQRALEANIMDVEAMRRWPQAFAKGLPPDSSG